MALWMHLPPRMKKVSKRGVLIQLGYGRASGDGRRHRERENGEGVNAWKAKELIERSRDEPLEPITLYPIIHLNVSLEQALYLFWAERPRDFCHCRKCGRYVGSRPPRTTITAEERDPREYERMEDEVLGVKFYRSLGRKGSPHFLARALLFLSYYVFSKHLASPRKHIQLPENDTTACPHPIPNRITDGCLMKFHPNSHSIRY